MDPSMAVITMFAGDFAPKYWAICSGQLLAISTNQALFSLLGTTFGGDGRTTFGLPDLRGRTPVHPGTPNSGIPGYVLGQTAGVENITLSLQNLPAHNHNAALNLGVSGSAANTDDPDGAVPALGTVTAYTQNASTNGQLGGVSVVVQNAGSSQPVSIRQPYTGINFIICMYGIFPSRN